MASFTQNSVVIDGHRVHPRAGLKVNLDQFQSTACETVRLFWLMSYWKTVPSTNSATAIVRSSTGAKLTSDATSAITNPESSPPGAAEEMRHCDVLKCLRPARGLNQVLAHRAFDITCAHHVAVVAIQAACYRPVG